MLQLLVIDAIDLTVHILYSTLQHFNEQMPTERQIIDIHFSLLVSTPIATSLFPLYLSLSPLPLASSPTVIEKYTENTRFCLICNYLSKI